MKLIAALIIAISSVAYATSGRTDKYGGHHTKDCQHDKGICYYHFHKLKKKK